MASTTLDGLLAESARAHPDRPAVVDPGRAVLTYRELDERASRIAEALSRRAGVGSGDRVAVHAPNLRVERVGAG